MNGLLFVRPGDQGKVSPLFRRILPVDHLLVKVFSRLRDVFDTTFGHFYCKFVTILIILIGFCISKPDSVLLKGYISPLSRS